MLVVLCMWTYTWGLVSNKRVCVFDGLVQWGSCGIQSLHSTRWLWSVGVKMCCVQGWAMSMLLVCGFVGAGLRVVSLITARSTECVTGSSPNWTWATDIDDQRPIHLPLITSWKGGLHYKLCLATSCQYQSWLLLIAMSSISWLIRHTNKKIDFSF